jgi:hypothetical protein
MIIKPYQIAQENFTFLRLITVVLNWGYMYLWVVHGPHKGIHNILHTLLNISKSDINHVKCMK